MSFSKNNTKLVGRVARKPLWIFLIFFALAVLFLVAEGIYKDIIHDGFEPGPKLATVEYAEPTKDFPNGSVERWSYKNGFFSFDTRNARSRLIAASEETSLMVVMGASWREFYDKKTISII
ncbi:hypothetical protein ACLD02_10095 [Alloalcanivorax sp. C16-2]|uniref:hypothetical protein n=1 Tax=Alloalcanivorax sp. C16-2 TaxID=3390052 RepID=UPI003970FAFC